VPLNEKASYTRMKHISIQRQPNDSTCGPTSLQAVYSYYEDKISLEKVIKEVHALEDGGTLAVLLGQHALARGYSTTIYTFNLKVIDPTWDLKDNDLVIEKMRAQLIFKKDRKLRMAIQAYIGYLEAGGKLRSVSMSRSFFARHFAKGIPILAGLSATYLYQTKREYFDEFDRSVYDDLKGSPMGHFVLVSGFDKEKKIRVSDPYPDNPVSGNSYYSVSTSRLIHSILLGIVTYDANLLVIERPE
jgi:hypothetical protein